MSAESVSVEEIVTALQCARKYEFEFEHTITASPQQEIESAREDLLRSVIVQSYQDTEDGDVDDLRDTARTIFDELWNEHAGTRYYQSQAQRRYDRQAVWAAIDNYIDEYGEDHLSRLIAAGETGLFSRDVVNFSIKCDLDLLLEGRNDSDDEIIRFIPTMAGIIWPYDGGGNHPVDSLLQGNIQYLRQKASVLRAIASRLTALQTIIQDPLASVEFQYFALMNDTYPTGPITEDGGSVTSELAVRDMTGYIIPGNMGSRLYGNSDTQLSNGQFALFDLANMILRREYDPSQQDFDQIYQYVCEYCKFQLMCPDFVNEEVSF